MRFCLYDSIKNKLQYGRVGVLILFLALLAPAFAVGQDPLTEVDGPAVEQVPAEEVSVVVSMLEMDDVPGLVNLAASISDPSSRTESLMTMIVVAHLINNNLAPDPRQFDALETRFREDRAWLDQLAGRYEKLPMRSTILDPAAWLVTDELRQQNLITDERVSPLGPGLDDIMRLLFDRSDENLAAALLPAALVQIETRSIGLWQAVLEAAAIDGSLLALISMMNDEWFKPWTIAEPPELLGSEVADPDPAINVISAALADVQAMVGVSVFAQAPDPLRLRKLRFGLLTALPELEPQQSRDAAHLLRLATAIDGLQDWQYLQFIESLIWVVADLLLNHDPVFPAESPLPDGLAEMLPLLSNAFARNFSDVDPRLNANLAAAFDTVQNLQAGELNATRLSFLRRELADAVAQLVLLIPDMDFYFNQPVRQRISEEIDICASIVAAQGDIGDPNLTRKQFDGCLGSMVNLAEKRTRRAELAGDPDGPFGPDQLRRELELMPWQRINFALGYLHELHPGSCQAPDRSVPNPLEWSVLATMLSWFAEQSPVYFQTPENELLIAQMREQGASLLQTMSAQVECLSGKGEVISDPVTLSLENYRAALFELVAGIRDTELKFREEQLAPGADVVLKGDASQGTSYRSEGLMISPCDERRVCEMTNELETTRALIGLFPDEYLLADQTGLGSIDICYDNMQWVDRRLEPVRPDDPNVANFYGHLSFDLVGRYLEGDDLVRVFGSRFVSPEEYHYLFGAATDEVLADSCPMEWVGTKITTNLGGTRKYRIVPDRLTYLSAIRSRPSQVIESNWSAEAEWRDWFVTGTGVSPLEVTPNDSIHDRLNQHLAALYQSEQSMLYLTLLNTPARGTFMDESNLYELMSQLTTSKALVRAQMNLFYPDMMLDSNAVRSLMEGHGSLLDDQVLRRLREARVPMDSIYQIGTSRLEQLQSAWNRQPDASRRTGSVAISVANAITRLDAIFYRFFALPPKSADRVFSLNPIPGPDG